jgi:hypothetical protein
MTPQEKAIQLVDNFMDLSEEQEYDTPRYMPKEMAVKCALMAVDEVIYNIEPSVSMDVISARIKYWEQVKQEIKKA